MQFPCFLFRKLCNFNPSEDGIKQIMLILMEMFALSPFIGIKEGWGKGVNLNLSPTQTSILISTVQPHLHLNLYLHHYSQILHRITSNNDYLKNRKIFIKFYEDVANFKKFSVRQLNGELCYNREFAEAIAPQLI